MMMLLLLMAAVLIITSSSLNVHYGHMYCFKKFLFNGNPFVMYIFRSCRCMPPCMEAWMCFVAMHAGMSGLTLMESVFMFIPAISSSLFSM